MLSREADEAGRRLSSWAFVLMVAVGVLSSLQSNAPGTPEPVSQVRDRPIPIRESFKDPGELPRRGRVVSVNPEVREVDEKYFNDLQFTLLQKKTMAPKIFAAPLSSYSVTKSPFIVSALASNLKLYPANAFLLHFVPFTIESPWQALSLVANQLKYEKDDHLFFGGFSEVRQTSAQTYRHARGDCEDRSILLADWLIQQGYDARVAVGDYDEKGHAWVVLIMNNESHILESTSYYSSRKPDLAGLLPKYHPEYMFNQNELWANFGSKYTVNYTDSHWIKVSNFIEK